MAIGESLISNQDSLKYRRTKIYCYVYV